MSSKFWKRILPENVYEQLRSLLVFKPEDPNNLLQVPPRFMVEGTGVPRIKGFRYPAPGSQPPAFVPTVKSTDDFYNNLFYTRDSRNLPNKLFTTLNTPEGPVEYANKRNNVIHNGKKKQVTFAYDPSGLRTPRSAALPAFEAEIRKIEPDHLPEPEWMKHLDEMEAEAKRKGIPQVMGRRYKPRYLSPGYNQVYW